MTSGPPHPVVLGQPIGTLWSNIRARPIARSPPCRPDASVSPLQVPVAAPSVRGGTRRTRVPGVCNRHNTSRLVRGRLRKIWRHASPRRPPATAVDARRAIRVEGIFRILLHHQKLLKNTIVSIAHVPASCKKTHYFVVHRVFSNIDAASLPQNVYYRVIAVREGGHAPETRPASSDIPPHHPACMTARCDAPVALLPPVPPSRLTL